MGCTPFLLVSCTTRNEKMLVSELIFLLLGAGEGKL